MDATDKYDQLLYSAIGMTPQQAYFQNDDPNLKSLFIFGQVSFVPIMDQKISKNKYN